MPAGTLPDSNHSNPPGEPPVQKGFKIVNMGVHTVHNVYLELTPGQCVGLTGPSGSGKSLFLRALADLDPHEGHVWLDGVGMDQIQAPEWRRRVGLLPAESAWWHDTVGPHFETVPKGWLEALGFETGVLDWKVSRLSSGERQRLALLRLLVLQPRVLLLDEPTANLDRGSLERAEKMLDRHRRARSLMMIWVSHDLEQLQRNCDPIYLIENNGLITFDPRSQANHGKPP